jgi:signal transduction histidine kinase/CheY-like chemotaxis protein
MTTAADDSGSLLSTLPAGRHERRLALWTLLVSAAFFVVAVPFAKAPLAPVPAFIPVYQSALVVVDLITAVLLFGQFRILGQRRLLILGVGYLFTAFMAAAHALTFPGLFAPGGLLGAGPQTTAWLYMFWHGLFPLCVIVYALMKTDAPAGHAHRPANAGVQIARGVVAAFVIMAAFVLTATALQDALPAIMAGNRYTPAMIVVVSSVWGLALLALVCVWRRRPHSVLDLWLMVVMCAWLFDIALSAVLNAGRFDLGFYAGRIYGLLAGSFVLLLLLLENGALYARERRKATEAKHLGLELAAANQALAAQNRQLEQADRLKSEFLANMSHELRTPLNAIIGFSELMREGLAGEMTERQREFANDIHVSGTHLLSLINDVLDLSKIEAGSMQLEQESVTLRPLLESCLAVVREKALSRRVELHSDIDPMLGTILGDTRKIKQIAYNLLSNAVKFSEHGGKVTLSARRVDRASVEAATRSAGRSLPPAAGDAEFVEITVDDTGIGIAAPNLARLFEPFVQVDASLTRRHEGTGLGLALVQRLVALHEGGLAVNSTLGQGSRFTAWLPYRAVAQAGQPVAPATLTRALPLALVIEDDDAAARLLMRELEGQGVAVLHASTAEEGLVIARKRHPDLIALDIFLPHIDGWECLERLRSDPETADIPVVIVTAGSEHQRGLSLGTVRVVQKPIARETVVGLLQQLGLGGVPAPTVLVADDDPGAVAIAASHLEAAGMNVLRAGDGREAIIMALAARPSLLILDLMMPEVSGFDVVAALRADPHGRAIPIVVVTSKSLSADERAELNGQVLRVLDKVGFSGDDFVSEVRRALSAAPAGTREHSLTH